MTLSLKLRVLKLASDSLCNPGGRVTSALNFMKRMLDACVSSTIRVALGKHLPKEKSVSPQVVDLHTFSIISALARKFHTKTKISHEVFFTSVQKTQAQRTSLSAKDTSAKDKKVLEQIVSMQVFSRLAFQSLGKTSRR